MCPHSCMHNISEWLKQIPRWSPGHIFGSHAYGNRVMNIHQRKPLVQGNVQCAMCTCLVKSFISTRDCRSLSLLPSSSSKRSAGCKFWGRLALNDARSNAYLDA